MAKVGIGAFADLSLPLEGKRSDTQNRRCERQQSEAIPVASKKLDCFRLRQTATADRSSQALLAMTLMTMLHPPPSSLRTQGPITPDIDYNRKHLPNCRKRESSPYGSRRAGRDDVSGFFGFIVQTATHA
jgi:hypothetical protein